MPYIEMKEIVFATNNIHKLKEARSIANGKLQILSLDDIGCKEVIPETSPTLEGNALQKAHWIKDHYGYDCFADDTGLMVDALQGRPGVYTARYAGENCTPADNVAFLLQEMESVTIKEHRTATFATVIALVTSKIEKTFRGEVKGYIANAPEGDGGFGYDPIFIAKESGQTFATMGADKKNAISHRGRAMKLFIEYISTL